MQQPWMVNWLLLTVTLAPLAAQAPTTDATSREAFAHYRAGQEQLGGERWDAAAQGFRAAIALDPRFVDAHCGLGQAYWAPPALPAPPWLSAGASTPPARSTACETATAWPPIASSTNRFAS